MTKLKIYGDSISGNCLKVKWTAERLGLDFDWIETSVLNRETRTPEFLKINPAGQVPTVQLSDGRILTQSNAIIVHLTEANDGDLLPEDGYARARVYEWLFWEQNSHETTIAVRRFLKAFLEKPDNEIAPNLIEKGVAALAHLENALKGASYLVGDALTLADISLVAYTRMAEDGGFALGDYPNVQHWIARVERALDLPPYEAA